MTAMDQKELLIGTKKLLLAEGIFVRFLRAVKSDRIELAVIITDEATAEALRGSWTRIVKLREFLRNQQGSDVNDVNLQLILQYVAMHKAGWSYGAIAKDINYDVLVHITSAVKQSDEDKIPVENTVRYTYAALLLRVMRMSNDEIDILLKDAAEDVRAGRAPWGADKYPVDEGRVREAIRQFWRESKSGKIIVKEMPRTEMASVEELYKKNEDAINSANELIERRYPESLRKHDNYVQRKLKEGDEQPSDPSERVGDSG